MAKGKLLRRWEKISAEQQRAYLEEANRNTDRGTAILVGAYLDTQLEVLLSSFMIADAPLVDRLFNPTQPLGSFGARMMLAYGLGLISEVEHHDLKIIQSIRNDFAHDLHGLTFQNDSITSRIENLTVGQEVWDLENYPRVYRDIKLRFTTASSRLMYLLNQRINDVSERGGRQSPEHRPFVRSGGNASS